MFEKFGEFDSVEELNRAAASQKEEGDEEALVLLAEENGIDKEDAEDYLDDYTNKLTTPLMAALGKLKVEIESYKISGVLLDWAQEIEAECIESEEMARAVRRKGKDLGEYIARLTDKGFKNKTVVDKEIIKKCGEDLRRMAGTRDLYIGIPDKSERMNMMNEYYLGE